SGPGIRNRCEMDADASRSMEHLRLGGRALSRSHPQRPPRGDAMTPRLALVSGAVLAVWTWVAAAKAPPSRPDAQQVVRASADATSVPVAVRKGNRPVPNLTAADFDLFDNGVRQDITAVMSGTIPIDLTLVVDTSGSMTDVAAQMKADVASVNALLG